MSVENLAARSPVKFKVGDYIIHENAGACTVSEIGRLGMPGAPRDRIYYTLVPVFKTDSRLFTPVEGSKVAMRRILTREEALSLIDEVRTIEAIEITDEKEKERDYQRIIRLCDCRELMRMIKTLYLRKEFRSQENKKLASGDERCLKYATERLLEEFSLAIGSSMEDVEGLIVERITLPQAGVFE